MDVNQRIGDYEILEELGRGGMGRVYRVRNVISDRVEAMKVLLPDLVSQSDLESRFLREIKVLASLEHPNIATLRTAMQDGDRVVMIMEFVDGESLAQRVKRGPIPVAEAIAYIDQVLDALSYAHARGVIHRDIKPANMMLATDGYVKLTDFGIARSQNDVTLTAAGTTTGSLAYMSPEQVNAEPTDARSDLYSVGISLYEMVTGQRPFQADSDFGVMVAHLKEMPRPPIELAPALGPELNAVIMKAIAKSPAERYQSADDFRNALTTVPAFAALIGEGTAPDGPPVPVPVPIVPASQTETVPRSRPDTATVAPITSERVRSLVNAPSPAAVAPVPAVPPVPQPVMRKPANAVLYMAIGGVFTIAALVAAAMYINSARSASAGTPATAATSTPAAAPAAAATSAQAATVPAPSNAAPDIASSAAAGTVTSDANAVTSSPSSAAAGPTASADSGTNAPAPASGAPATSPAPVASAASSTGASASTAPSENPVATRSDAAGAPASGAARPLAQQGGPPRLPPAARRALAGARARENAAEANVPANAPAREAATPSTQPMEPAVDFDELEAEIDQLSARVVSINTSLDNLRREQARQGLGLRGDITARQQTMNSNVTRAAEAVSQKNAARALRFKAAAEADIESLERFLGR